jgi:O-antigen ligase
MKSDSLEKILVFFILTSLTATTIFIAPWSVTHPYSVPKLIPLVSFSLPLLHIIYLLIDSNKIKDYKSILLILITYFFGSIIILISRTNNLTQELYGVWGRNNGFISHFSFLLLMLASLFYPIKKSLNIFIKVSLTIGLVSLLYGIMQYLKLVKISKITNENTESVGFFGNENFYSAFIGMISVICFSMVFNKSNSKLNRGFYFLFSVFGNIGIYLANSQQGFLVFFIGSIVIFLAWIKTSNFKQFTIPFILSSLFGLVVVIFGFFQIGPLSKYVYQQTLTFRGYYWRAGIKMFLDNPIIGVGFDSYRDFYRKYRESGAVKSLGPTDIADSAHNNFIDMAVNGGLFLLLPYLLIIFYVLFCTFRLLLKMSKFDTPVVAIVAAWYAFTTQQFVSLPQPGLTVWGWVLSGLIIAIYKQDKYEISKQEQEPKKKPSYLIISIFFFIGLLVTIPPFRASAEYRKAVEAQDVSILIKAAKMYPQDATMLAASGGALIGLGYFEDARNVLNISIDKFPRYYESWYIYSLLPNLSEAEVKRINEKMVELDPLLDINSTR